MTSQHPSLTSAKHSATPDWIMPGRRLIQAGMRMLGAISPSRAASIMQRLWFSAPRTMPRAADQAVLDVGESLSFRVDGREVAAWSWGEEGPTVFLLHGWGGNAGQLQAFVMPLLEAGFRVVAFDAPSHGASAASRHGGRTVTFFEFAESLKIIAAGESHVAGIIAHSGGCTAVSLALRAGWTPPASLVFIAPFVRPEASIDAFAHAIGANDRVIAAFRDRVEHWLGHPWSYLDIATMDAAHKQARLLVIHDEDDKEVPLSHAFTLVNAWPSARLMVTRGLGHRRVLRDPAVLDSALSFLAQEAPSALRGARSYLPRDSRSALDRAYEACVSHGSAIGAR